MPIAPYLREIGRGAAGSRPLKPEQAHDLMAQLLDDRLSALEVGARVRDRHADEGRDAG
jgi:hypothetical protein